MGGKGCFPLQRVAEELEVMTADWKRDSLRHQSGLLASLNEPLRGKTLDSSSFQGSIRGEVCFPQSHTDTLGGGASVNCRAAEFKASLYRLPVCIWQTGVDAATHPRYTFRATKQPPASLQNVLTDACFWGDEHLRGTWSSAVVSHWLDTHTQSRATAVTNCRVNRFQEFKRRRRGGRKTGGEESMQKKKKERNTMK